MEHFIEQTLIRAENLNEKPVRTYRGRVYGSHPDQRVYGSPFPVL